MSALPLAVVLQLIASCAPTVAPSTMASVLRTESGFDPNELHVNGPNGGEIHVNLTAIRAVYMQFVRIEAGLGAQHTRHRGGCHCWRAGRDQLQHHGERQGAHGRAPPRALPLPEVGTPLLGARVGEPDRD